MGAQVRLLPAGGPPRAEGPGPPALDSLSVLLASSHQPLGLSYRGVRRHCRAVPPGLAASPSLGSPAVCSCSEQLFRFRLSWVRRCWMEASFFFFFFFCGPHPEPWNLHPLQWKHRVLTTGSPAKSWDGSIFSLKCIITIIWRHWVFPGDANGKEFSCQCRRHGYNPWVEKIPWSRKWQPISLFLPGKSHAQRSLAGYSPWDLKESDMTQ